MRLLCLVPLALCACAISEDRFDDLVAEKWCAREKACDEDLFFDEWVLGTPDCRVAIADQVNDHRYGNGNAACTYSPDAAADCVRDVLDASCEDILSPGYVDTCVSPAWDCISIVNPGNP